MAKGVLFRWTCFFAFSWLCLVFVVSVFNLQADSLYSFKRKLKTHLFTLCVND